METHHYLDVWYRVITFDTHIYSLTNKFPASKLYCLTNQIRRAVVSIPSNIEEGAARNIKKDFTHFLAIILGSIAELETQLMISKSLEFFKIRIL